MRLEAHEPFRIEGKRTRIDMAVMSHLPLSIDDVSYPVVLTDIVKFGIPDVGEDNATFGDVVAVMHIVLGHCVGNTSKVD